MVIDMGDKSAEDVRALSPSLFQPHELRTEEGLDWSTLPEKVWVLGPDLRTLYVYSPKGGTVPAAESRRGSSPAGQAYPLISPVARKSSPPPHTPFQCFANSAFSNSLNISSYLKEDTNHKDGGSFK